MLTATETGTPTPTPSSPSMGAQSSPPRPAFSKIFPFMADREKLIALRQKDENLRDSYNTFLAPALADFKPSEVNAVEYEIFYDNEMEQNRISSRNNIIASLFFGCVGIGAYCFEASISSLLPRSITVLLPYESEVVTAISVTIFLTSTYHLYNSCYQRFFPFMAVIKKSMASGKASLREWKTNDEEKTYKLILQQLEMLQKNSLILSSMIEDEPEKPNREKASLLAELLELTKEYITIITNSFTDKKKTQ